MSHSSFKDLLETIHMLGGWKSIKKNVTAVMLWIVDPAYSQKCENNSTLSKNKSCSTLTIACC